MTLTRARIIQYVGILLSLGLIAVGYWYFSASAGVKKNTSASQPQGTGQLDSGLRGYWKLDDASGTTAVDSSTNGNNGTLTNGPTWTTGQIGGAVTFDGTNDYVDLGSVATNDVDAPFTQSVWAYPTSATDAKILFEGQDANGTETYIETVNSFGNLVLKVGINGSGTGLQTGYTPTNTWYHIVMTYDSTTLSFYLNGSLYATANYAGSITERANNMRIGADKDGVSNYSGKVDEVRVYDRLLSADEVGQLYRLTAPTSVDTSLKGYWSFNAQDMNGTTAYDRSGAGNTGTLTNGPTKVVGRVGQAINFDGSNDYVEAGSATSLDNLTNKTGCAWIYPQSGNALGTIMSKSSTVGWEFSLKHNSGSPMLELYTTFSGTDGSWDSPANSIKYGIWQHVCFTYNNSSTSNVPIFYIDGKLTSVTGVTPTGTVDSDASENFEIGVLGGSSEAYTGRIDEVRIMNRILTVSEIKAQYDLGAPDNTNTSASQTQGVGRLDSGLTAYYPLDNGSGTTATDASTNGNDGTLTNGPLWVTGQVGSAVDFDGVDDYIQKTDVAVQDFGDTDNFTLSGWFNRDTATSDDVILAKRTSLLAASAGYIVYLDATTDQLIFEVSDGTDEYSLTSTSTFTTTGWNHFVVVWDQDNATNSEIYINGIANSATDSGTIGNIGDLSNAVSFGIGVNSLAQNPFDGKIDEIRVYDRTLSIDEIGQLYRLTAPTTVDTSLKAYWPLNGLDNESTTTYDRSGARNNGTLTNSPTKTIGKLGQALAFASASSQYVNAGSASGVDDLVNLTSCAWVRPNSNLTTYGDIIAKFQPSPNTGWQFSFDYTTLTSLRLSFYRTFSGTDGHWLTAVPIPYNEWSFVCATYNNSSTSNDPIFYVNGTAVSVVENLTPTGTVDTDAAGSIYLGAFETGSGPGEYFNGTLDEIRLYNRILTANEIKAQYDLGAPDKGNTSASQPQGTGRLDSDLVGYWKLDENTGTSAADSSTNGNTGTLTNGPTWITGQIGSGVQFDGTNDHINAGTGSNLVLTDRRTIAAWVYITGTMVNGDTYYITRKYSSGDSNSYYGMELFHNGTGITVESYQGGGGAFVRSSSYLTAGQWYHLAVTFDKPTVSFYINGQLDSTGSDSVGGGYPSGSGTMFIGSSSGAGYMNGRLDDVRVYGRTLSADEIGQLYRLRAPTGTDTSLKGYWSFNGQDMNATTAFDRSGTGSNGTLTGGPTKTIGKLGQGLSFDGTDDYIELGSYTTEQTVYTVAFWIYQTGSLTGSPFHRGDSGGCFYNPRFDVDSTTVTLAESGCSSTGVVGSASLPVGWHHVAATRNGSASKLYVDGELVPTTGASAGALGTSNGRTVIGASWQNNTTYGGYLNTKMDEVRVYNREFSAVEIKNLYNQSK